MKNRITKFSAIAVILIAAAIIINLTGGSIDGANTAWANVIKEIQHMDHVHFYIISQDQEDPFPSIREGWYGHGKMKLQSCGGFSSYGSYQSYDDGQTCTNLDRHYNINHLGISYLSQYPNLYETLLDGMISLDASQLNSMIPSKVGTDFLTYDFEPLHGDYIKNISITVGRNSLLPLKIKIEYDSENWGSDQNTLYLFDYDEDEKPPAFFDLPQETKPPHGAGQLSLGGDPVEIEIHNTPGITKAIVQLHTKFEKSAEDLPIPYRQRHRIADRNLYFMSISFIIEEGYQSIMMPDCPLWLNLGTKAALGNDKNWPDGKYRNIRFTPILRETEQEDVFTLELSCWLRTKETDL